MYAALALLSVVVPAARAVPVVLEHFDGDALPEGWRLTADKGSGKPSDVKVSGGALVLTVKPGDRRFGRAARRVELRGADWVVVHAKVTASPTGDPGQCGVYVVFDGKSLDPAHACTAGTTEVTRYYELPEGAYELDLGAFATAPGTYTVDDVSVEAVQLDWHSLVRGHFQYHWSGGSGYSESQLAANDAAYDKVAAVFGAPANQGVDYWWHADLDAVEQYTGIRAESVVAGIQVHSLWRGRTRELVDVLAQAWGDPPVVLREGLAVELDGEWDGSDLRLGARRLAGEGTLPGVAALLDPAAFGVADPKAAHLAAGAFVGWLREAKGEELWQKVCAATKSTASVADNTKAIEGALGMKLTDVDAAVRAWLAG